MAYVKPISIDESWNWYPEPSGDPFSYPAYLGDSDYTTFYFTPIYQVGGNRLRVFMSAKSSGMLYAVASAYLPDGVLGATFELRLYDEYDVSYTSPLDSFSFLVYSSTDVASMVWQIFTFNTSVVWRRAEFQVMGFVMRSTGEVYEPIETDPYFAALTEFYADPASGLVVPKRTLLGASV
ncbi:MAG: hypothetical protein KatS3mg087_0505 [Patescibacteria group bacterium]|nr:MAG: hypothetical protein KatS3mg087_0505 [Patescibacteria group bacterium]